MLQEYLAAYTTALKRQPFQLVYIDAFAGTGYRELRSDSPEAGVLFPELAKPEPQELLQGSVRISLQVVPPFHKYIFIEKSRARADELRKLPAEFALLEGRIEVVQEDCNVYLQRIAREWTWTGQRAVLFLDPFGMQVDWETVAAVASTRAVDVWILFPLGVGVNRLLKKDGQMRESWRRRLDKVFGTPNWQDEFYRERPSDSLFPGEPRGIEKVGGLEKISAYYNQRLRTVFAKVAENPRLLCNSRGSPLFLLCFAASNPKGAPIAIQIAQSILRG